MTSAEGSELIRLAYAARSRGDLEGTMAAFTEDGSFQFNGAGTGIAHFSEPAIGPAALRAAMSGLISNYEFEDWTMVDQIFSDQKASVHWRAKITCVNTKKSAVFDVVDLFEFANGKIKTMFQSTDTALLLSVIS